MNQTMVTAPALANESGHKPVSVLVLGEALVDLFADGPQPGGAPFNVARSLASMQVPVTFISRVGQADAWGQAVRLSAEHFGLSLQGLQVDPLYPTGSVQVVQHGSGHTFEIGVDAAWDYLNLAQASAVVQSIAPPAFVYFGTLAQRNEVSRHTIRALVQATSAIRYLDLNLRDDPQSRSLALASLQLADWVKVNDEELLHLLEWTLGVDLQNEAWGSPRIQDGITRLMEHFQLHRLVVTRGAMGYACFDASGHCEAEGGGLVLQKVVDTVGAGDGFSARLIASHIEGQSIAQSLSNANAYAAQICGYRGPMIALDTTQY